MNNKGFTLVEVIMVVAIIALLTLILVPNVTSLLKKNKIDSCNNLIDSIEKAASIYISDNRYNIKISDCDSSDTVSVDGITIKTLATAGVLTSPVINPIDNSTIIDSTPIDITYNCSTKQFSYNVNIDCGEE